MADWPGCRRPTYTMVPDEVLDELMPALSGAEFKVLLYIVRRTLGFKKEADTISLSQLCHGITRRDGTVLDRGTGLGRSTVVAALKSLEQRGVIVATRRQAPDGQNDVTTYTLRWADDEVVSKSNHQGPEIEPEVVRKSDPQQTVQHTEVDQPVSLHDRIEAAYHPERVRPSPRR